jgi:dipeptidyl aminopeptidase/acylaminoacyl peptidase
MTKPTILPYGAWKSPITADLIVKGTISLGQITLDGSDLYWLEGRPTEGGRMVIVRRAPGGAAADVLPAPYNARSRVHEYGGGSYTVARGQVYFVNFTDQRIYRVSGKDEPRPLTPEAAWRYADLQVDARRERLVCVGEDHTQSDQEAVNSLVSVPLDGGEPSLLESGRDFYASPRLSPDGTRLSWLSWDHPNMPWDGTDLWVAEFGPDGLLTSKTMIAGGIRESIFQPEWSPEGDLYFVSDRTGWWNLYRWNGRAIDPLMELEAEFGRPLWVFGMSNYGFLEGGRVACTYTRACSWHLGVLDVRKQSLEPLETPYSSITDLRASGEQMVLIAGSPSEPFSVLRVEPHSGDWQVLKRSSSLEIDPGYISQPRPIEFPTSGGETAHGLYYPPVNRDFAAPAGEKPPLIVFSHGGPTSTTDTSLKPGIQYWTSRGFSVLDVNYGGSTGYGRPYRERLAENWGVVDVDDCTNGAQYLVQQGLVDGNRLAIRGGSAGGFTTLSALTFRDVFKAGASHFGVSDLEALATDTHKFESRYLDKMVGSYPDRKDVYWARSPLHHLEKLTTPVIFFQGLDDRVVPPSQAERMVSALRDRGVPVAYLAFAGEGHGFRKAENIQRTLEAELYFYQRIFGIPVDPDIEPVEIANFS